MRFFNLFFVITVFQNIISNNIDHKVSKYVLEVNDQKIIDEVKEYLEKYKSLFEKQINFLNKAFKEEIITEKEIKNQKRESAEELLAELKKEVIILNKKNAPYFYINDLKQFTNKLVSACTSLKKIITKLTKKLKHPVDSEIVNMISLLLKEVEIKVIQLKNFKAYLNIHKNYFDFANVVLLVNIEYEEEIKIVDNDKEDIIANKIKKIARKKYNQKKENRSVIGSLFAIDLDCPLVEYEVSIGYKVNEIQKNIKNKNNSNYLKLIDNAAELKEKFEKIKQIISSDEEYFVERRSVKPNDQYHYVYRI